MFSGLVQEIGRISAISKSAGITRLQIDAPVCAPRLEVGGSLAVNGICLTVVAKQGRAVKVDVLEQTRRISTLESWHTGDRVHLEPALRAGDSLGGHLVLGHIDGVGLISDLRKMRGGFIMEINAPVRMVRWLLPKGSIAVDGVSLTLDTVSASGRFRLNLIPHTLSTTLFAGMRSGNMVNLEADILAKGSTNRIGFGESPAPDLNNDGSPGLAVQDILDKGFRRLGIGHS